MKIPNRYYFYLLFLLTCGVLMARDINSKDNEPCAGIHIKKEQAGYTFFENGKNILFYQMEPKSLNGEYTRCHYIHPLYGLESEILTEDFPEDHLHQRGIFWAWHQILVGDKQVGDSWSIENFSWDIVESSIIDTLSNRKTLKVIVHWKSPLWTDSSGPEKPLVRETLFLSVYPAHKDYRVIDFETELLALEQNISIGGSDDVKGYGGFSARFRLPLDIRFTGTDGPVVPQNTSVDAGPWVDFSGSYSESGTSGITIFCHSANPQFPQRWILRQQKSMQNPVFPGREPVHLETDEPVILRYRLLVHRGNHNYLNLNKLFQNYNESPTLFRE